jgi:uncharacterized protein (TIGR02145 family)
MKMNMTENTKYTAKALVGIAVLAVALIQGCVIDPESFNTVKDIDGNRYGTIAIGSQTWMTSNLKTTRYTDGTPIPLVEDSVKWESTTNPAYCWYGNNQANAGNYGGLYNFYVFDTVVNGGKKLCPVGWHVPTLDEWDRLIEFAGGYQKAGFTLKDREFNEWVMKVEYPINLYGFSAFPGGYRNGWGTFSNRGEWATFWTSTKNSSTSAHGLVIAENSSFITLNDKLSKKIGSSIRCIKD